MTAPLDIDMGPRAEYEVRVVGADGTLVLRSKPVFGFDVDDIELRPSTAGTFALGETVLVRITEARL